MPDEAVVVDCLVGQLTNAVFGGQSLSAFDFNRLVSQAMAGVKPTATVPSPGAETIADPHRQVAGLLDRWRALPSDRAIELEYPLNQPRSVVSRGTGPPLEQRLSLDGNVTPALPRAMETHQLTERAMQIRQCFAKTELAENSRPWTREEIMQGFVVDVGDLMKLVMAKAGARPMDEVDRKLAHELSDCLWSVLVLARLYDVDLEKEYLATMAGIEAKLARDQSSQPPVA